MNVGINGREVELGGRYVGTDLRDSTDAVADPAALRERLGADGYVLIRGLLDRDQVLDARLALLEPLAADGTLDASAPLVEGALAAGKQQQHYPTDWKNPMLRALTTSTSLTGLFERVLGGHVVTYDYKWLRAIGPGGMTRLHWDAIFWEAGNVYSCWIPLGDIPVELGPLAVLTGAVGFTEQAQRGPRELLTSFDYWDTIDPFEIMDRTGGRLQTTDFRAGDVVAFTMYTAHTTLQNQTNRIRLSTDVRFQLTTEPLDEQYMGEDPPFLAKAAQLFKNR